MGGRNRRAAAAARRGGRRRGLGGARILEGGGREAEGNGKGRPKARDAVAMGGAPWPGKVSELAAGEVLVVLDWGELGTLEEGDEVMGSGLSGLVFEFMDRAVSQNIWAGEPNIWTHNSGKLKGSG